jgi:tetratricopeptide (TPR) repeat protein
VADIFISYTSSDRDWAFWIAKELEALGHTPRVHEWEIKGGDDIYAWMEQRHDAADHVLCVISDAYLKAPYSTLERNAALWQAAAKRPGFVLFVVVKPCHLPTLSDHYRRCQIYGLSDDEAKAQFRAFMGKREAAPIAFPGEAFAVSNIPIRVPEHFLGRETSLAAVEAALARYEGRVAITALHGLRGVGKTTLAAAYAERHRGDYRATWWIRAQTLETMRADLVGLGVRLKWVAADEKEELALAAVMERLRNEGQGLLLIYDNATDAEALRPYLPRGGAARVLVTSNAHTWRGVAQSVEIRLWPKEVGADYLLARTGRGSERAAAEALSVALGGLPLAHEQAAAYCERLDMPLAEYHRRFDATPAGFLDDARHAPAEYHDGLTVAKTFALAIEKAARLHPAAEPLIVHCALLAPESIPLFLFSEGRETFEEPFRSALEGDGLIEAVAALRTFALVDRETIADERDPAITTDCIRLHRLVRQVAAERCEEQAQEVTRGRLIEALHQAFREETWWDIALWSRARRLDALVALLVGGDTSLPAGSERTSAELLCRLGLFLTSAFADYARAMPLHKRALAIAEATFGAEDALTAASLHNVARVLYDQGDLGGGRALFERVLAINEKVLGPDDPNVARDLDQLARVLEREGDLEGARRLFERSLDICERALGDEAAATASALSNLGLLLQAQDDLAGAQPLLERALKISEKTLGPDHPWTGSSIDNLGRLLHARGDLAAARPLYERALKIVEKALGPDHRDLVFSLNNLARLLREQGDFAGARPLFERALGINRRVLGPGHLYTAIACVNLGSVLQETGETAEAEALYEQALASGAIAPEDPLRQRVETLRAQLMLLTDRTAEALRLGEAALAALELSNGPAHPWTKASASVTAGALDALGRGEAAAALRATYEIEKPAA